MLDVHIRLHTNRRTFLLLFALLSTMRYAAIVLAEAAALVAASPAVQPIDFAAVEAVPSPSLTGPPLGVASQTGVYNHAAALASASAVATAGPEVARRWFGDGDHHWPWGGDDCDDSDDSDWGWGWGHDKRGFPWPWGDDKGDSHWPWPWGWGDGHGHHHHGGHGKKCTTYVATMTHTHTGWGATTHTTKHHDTQTTTWGTPTSPPTTTGPTTTAPSKCTPVSWTNTHTYTSDSSCPTPYEVGKSCDYVDRSDPCVPQPAGKRPVIFFILEILIWK